MDNKYPTPLLFVLALIVGAFMGYTLQDEPSLGFAPGGVPVTVATTSNPTVNTSAAVVFSTSTVCAARSVTTYASPIMMTFKDGFTPTALFGTLQGASTTVTYDAEQYGCGMIRIYSFATQAITVVESR